MPSLRVNGSCFTYSVTQNDINLAKQEASGEDVNGWLQKLKDFFTPSEVLQVRKLLVDISIKKKELRCLRLGPVTRAETERALRQSFLTLQGLAAAAYQRNFVCEPESNTLALYTYGDDGCRTEVFSVQLSQVAVQSGTEPDFYGWHMGLRTAGCGTLTSFLGHFPEEVQWQAGQGLGRFLAARAELLQSNLSVENRKESERRIHMTLMDLRGFASPDSRGGFTLDQNTISMFGLSVSLAHVNGMTGGLKGKPLVSSDSQADINSRRRKNLFPPFDLLTDDTSLPTILKSVMEDYQPLKLREIRSAFLEMYPESERARHLLDMTGQHHIGQLLQAKERGEDIDASHQKVIANFREIQSMMKEYLSRHP